MKKNPAQTDQKPAPEKPWQRSPLAKTTFAAVRQLFTNEKGTVSLPEEVTCEVLRIKKHIAWKTQAGQIEPDEIFRSALLGMGTYDPSEDDDEYDAEEFSIGKYHNPREPILSVIRYGIMHLAGLKSDVLENRAVAAYRGKKSDYDRDLGRLIPERLRVLSAHADYVANTSKASEDWPVYLDRRTRRGVLERGLHTGLNQLDAMLGGIRGLTLLAGPPGSGRAALAEYLAIQALQADNSLGVLALSLKLTKDGFFDRLLSMVANVPYQKLKESSWPTEPDKKLAEAQELLKATILPRLKVVGGLPLDDDEGAVANMRKLANDLAKTAGLRNVLIVVDSMHDLRVLGPKKIEEDGESYGDLNDLDRDEARLQLLLRVHRSTGCPILAVTQTRKTEPKERLTLVDVVGKSRTLYDADCVLLMQPDPAGSHTNDVTKTLVQVATVRDGGQRGAIVLDFLHTVSQFREPALATRPTESPAAKGSATKARRFAGK